MKRNVSGQTVSAQMINASTGADFTGTVSVRVTKDGGTQTAGGGSVTHEGNGEHSYAPTQSETDAAHVLFQFYGTGAITVGIQTWPSFPQTADVASGVAVNSIAANAITATAIASGAITSAKIADNAINALTIADNAITALKINAGAITAAKFAAGAIDAAAIATDAIDADALKADAVTKIQNGLATAAGVPSAAANAAATWAATSGYGGQSYETVVTGLATESSGTADAVVAIETDTQDIQASLAALTAAAIATAVWDAVSEAAESYGDQLRLMVAALVGKATVQDDDGSYAFRDAADSKDRIAGSRTATARTVSTRDGS